MKIGFDIKGSSPCGKVIRKNFEKKSKAIMFSFLIRQT